MKVAIASDHGGYRMKNILKQYLATELGIEVIDDFGPYDSNSVDYPDFAQSLVAKISESSNSKGILICGSGVGMSIAANRHSNIRAGLAFNSNIGSLIRKHNDANVLVLPGRFIDIHEAIKCVDNFLKTKFEGGRHKRRIEKI